MREEKLKINKGKSGKCIAAGILAAVMLTGCGSKGENITLGMQAAKGLDYQGAIAYFEEAQIQGENPRLIARGNGIACMGMAEYEQAAAFFEEALSYSNGLVENLDYDLNYYLAAAYTKNGRLKEAEDTYSAILALRQEEADAFFLRGNIRLGLKDYENAIQDFENVMAMDSGNYDRLIQIYEVLATYGYKDAGLLYLQKAMQEGESRMNDYDKGRIYYYMGEYQAASLALEKAREKGGAGVCLYLGKSYEATGEYNYAASVYNAYLSKDSTNAQMYNQLGLCEMARGDYEKALAAFQAGMNVENNSVMQTLTFNEIVAYEYLGDYKKAAVLMESYLRTYPDDENAQREYEFLRTR